MVTLPVLIVAGGCSLLDNALDESIEPIDIDVGLINEGVAEPDQNHVNDLALSPSITGANPTWTSTPGEDSQEWGGTLLIDSMARASGVPTIVSVSVSDLVVQNEGGPFSLQVALVGDSAYSTELGGGEPVPPAACNLQVDPATTTAEDHAADLLACLHAWADTNGVPTDFALSVTGAARAAGFVYSATYNLATTETFQMDCTYDVVLPSSVIDMADSIEIEDLSIAGYGGAYDFGLELFAFADVFDGDGALKSTASLSQRIEGGQLYFIEAEVDIDPQDALASSLTPATNLASLNYNPTNATDWTLASYDALVGTGGTPGSADACWGQIHDDIPNTGVIRWRLVGAADPQL